MSPNLQEWFEFNDLKSKKYNKSIWIPLRASHDIIEEKSYGYDGYKNEFFSLVKSHNETLPNLQLKNHDSVV